MPDEQRVKELKLGDLETRKFLRPEKSLDEIEREKIGPIEKAKLADILSVTVIRFVFTLILLALFAWLNYKVMSLVRDIFDKTGTVEKEVLMTLIAGTVTEVAAVMYIMAQFLFPRARD